jgi:hypothetical protein
MAEILFREFLTLGFQVTVPAKGFQVIVGNRKDEIELL